MLSVFAVLLGCVSGAGNVDNPSVDARGDVAEAPVDGTLFPLDDANDETRDTAAPPEDTAPVPDTTVTPDTTPTCGGVGEPCCTGVCSSANYCFSGTCYSKPYAVEEGSDPGVCSDLGVTHIKPAFFARFIIHGRPTAMAYRYYMKVSCGDTTPKLAPGSPFTIASDGTYTFTIENTATGDCTNGNLGRYEAWFVIDGQETKHQYTAVFNSLCTAWKTCALGATACP